MGVSYRRGIVELETQPTPRGPRLDFQDYVEHRTRVAALSALGSLATVVDRSGVVPFERIDDPWVMRLFGGPFLQSPPPGPGLPAVSLVFVQSRDGNTEADDPAALGGGDIDKHLIYEGLTRLDADAVLSGARTVGRGHLVLSVWHPELVRIRLERGHRRHPLQVVLTATGDLPIESGLLFNARELQVVILAHGALADALRERTRDRPWIQTLSSGPISDPAAHTRALRERLGVDRISAIGGRTAATALLDAGIVQDLYLTTGAARGGRPGTPYYIGTQPPALDLVLRKEGRGEASGVVFEHFTTPSSRLHSIAPP
jgi:riboflavin biosynthesis pyrimidine reductase